MSNGNQDVKCYIDKYEHNLNFISHGITDRSKFIDWELVASFYAAIHLIEAVLIKKYNERSHNHDSRRNAMNDHPDIFNDVMIQYRRLHNYAHQARYYPQISFPDKVGRQTQNDLEDIAASLKKHVS